MRDFQFRESEQAHLLAVFVLFLVAIANCLPAAREFIARDEFSRRGSGVAVHETIDITAIPGSGLRRHHRANFRIIVRTALLNLASRGEGLSGKAGNQLRLLGSFSRRRGVESCTSIDVGPATDARECSLLLSAPERG